MGLTAFGGPIAHLGYFRDDFVVRRRWLDEATFAHIVAVCQLLPGPASSQVGMIIGLIRGGTLGAALAWIAFTLPSAIALTAFALGIARIPSITEAPWLHGLLVAAVAVVAFAVSNMFRSLCPDRARKTIAFATAAAVLSLPANGLVQPIIIALGAIYGGLFIEAPVATSQPLPAAGNRMVGTFCAVAFGALLLAFPIVQRTEPGDPSAAFGAFYEAGALVFGGGHVVLPLLQTRVVLPGWIAQETFLAGYGAAQAVPGPLFAFAAYVGAAMHGPFSGVAGASLALFAIYLPSFLLIAAILPFWNCLPRSSAFSASLHGVNAVVVGLLLAALYRPVWTSAIHGPQDVALASFTFALLAIWKTPAWFVVIFAALAAQFLHA